MRNHYHLVLQQMEGKVGENHPDHQAGQAVEKFADCRDLSDNQLNLWTAGFGVVYEFVKAGPLRFRLRPLRTNPLACHYLSLCEGCISSAA
jgi:hypothetical protein